MYLQYLNVQNGSTLTVAGFDILKMSETIVIAISTCRVL